MIFPIQVYWQVHTTIEDELNVGILCIGFDFHQNDWRLLQSTSSCFMTLQVA